MPDSYKAPVAPENCPEPFWHNTHRYCPCCTWTQPSGPETASFQDRVRNWAVECFGSTTADDVTERNWRFLEEALELVQSLDGSAQDAHALVDYVFGREPGKASQEVGGVMVTLAALCAARGINMQGEGEREYHRITGTEVMARIRRKHASKPYRSPLPGDYVQAKSEPKKREGWSRLLTSTRWHFFREGRSLCRKWGYFGPPTETDDKPSPDNCADCWRRRSKELAHAD